MSIQNIIIRGIIIAATILAITLAFMSCSGKHSSTAARHQPAKKVVADVLNGEVAPAEQDPLYLRPVHFATSSDTILADELAILESNIKWLRKNPEAIVVLEGHCDERGDEYYNIQLGDRRARQIKNHLMKYGIAADRLIMVVSYGERKPKDPRHIPDAWRANRRVEFIVR